MTKHIRLPNVITQLPGEDLEVSLTEPLGKLLLYSKGIAVKERRVRTGHYGIPEDENVIDLGNAIDIVPLARRLKALDMNNVDGVITLYDFESPEFKRIVSQSYERDGGCMYGTSFLIFERSRRRFLEFFCGTKSTRPEAGKISPFLPLTAADIDFKAKYGCDVSRLVPHGPQPLTLKSRQVKKGSYSVYAPVIEHCSTPFTDLPSPNDMAKEIQTFIDEAFPAHWWTRRTSHFQDKQREKGTAKPPPPAPERR